MRVWYERKLVTWKKLAEGTEKAVRPDILEGMRRGMREIEAKYGGAEKLECRGCL